MSSEAGARARFGKKTTTQEDTMRHSSKWPSNWKSRPGFLAMIFARGSVHADRFGVTLIAVSCGVQGVWL